MTTPKKAMSKAETDDFLDAAALFLKTVKPNKCVWAAMVVQTTEGSIKLATRHAPGSVKLPKS